MSHRTAFAQPFSAILQGQRRNYQCCCCCCRSMLEGEFFRYHPQQGTNVAWQWNRQYEKCWSDSILVNGLWMWVKIHHLEDLCGSHITTRFANIWSIVEVLLHLYIRYWSYQEQSIWLQQTRASHSIWEIAWVDHGLHLLRWWHGNGSLDTKAWDFHDT